MQITDIVKDIDILNRILNNMNVEGFHFVKNFDKIAICIPRERVSIWSNNYIIGTWGSLSQVFSGSHFPIRYLIKCIKDSREQGRNKLYSDNPVNFLGINNHGMIFCELIYNCSSYEEFMIKLQIMGYNV